ncbi:hypothetical protein SADUNF_Sadunf10G0052100 [Salix dunnii]|uniref:BAHD acyltransferase n=1 Tax=Salix dunnii TaxID=1413687 RepID=A0A835JQF0_9ROSI|nr:hypothetical protein SADUNF_Sadunf10G0052100 [Salix dunnii]
MEDGVDQLELQDLASRIRKELEELDKNYANMIQGDGPSLLICRSAGELGELAMGDDIESFKRRLFVEFAFSSIKIIYINTERSSGCHEVNVEIVTREVIKPSSPTLNHLRKFNLSLLDLLAPVSYEPLVLLYSNSQQQLTGTQKSQRLKRSLSVALTRFYPLAGRIKDGVSIECNDFGAVFVESRVSCVLSKFLEKPDAEVLRKFIPVGTESPEALTGSLVLVQANFFACGGLAIGACISHKVADPVTFSTFIKAWAAAAFGSVEDTTVLPLFNASSVFPTQNLSLAKPAAVELMSYKCVTKRVVFDSPKIAALQAKAASESVTCPTRVEAVTALIWKCAMNASRSNSERLRYSILSQSVNLRRRMVPPLPENTIGNLVVYFASCATECEIELQSLVGQLRKGLRDFDENYVKKLGEGKAFMATIKSFQDLGGNMLQDGNVDYYVSTNFCMSPFYGIDFGWGKPTWVTIPTRATRNVTTIMDTRDGKGVEAWVTLTEEDMTFFERDRELLAAASFDPNALDLLMPKSSL